MNIWIEFKKKIMNIETKLNKRK